jgi:hypothetical protein
MGLPSFAFTKPPPQEPLRLSAEERREWLKVYTSVVSRPEKHEWSYSTRTRAKEAADYAIRTLRERGAEHADGR